MALTHRLPATNVLHISWRGFNRASIISSVPSNGKRQVFCCFFIYKELHVRKLFTSPCTDIKETETAGNRRLYLLHFLVEFFPSIRLHKKKKSPVLHRITYSRTKKKLHQIKSICLALYIYSWNTNSRLQMKLDCMNTRK